MPAETNFLQFNPGAVNQETDAEYSGDDLRSGGIPVDAILPSPLLNKAWFQPSTMVAALAEAMVAAGLSPMDSNLATLIATLQTYFQSIGSTPKGQFVAFSATPVFDASLGSTFEMTLNGNVSSSSLINFAPYQVLTFIIHQNSTAGWSFAWPSIVQGAGMVDPGVFTSVQRFIVNGAGTAANPLTPLTVS